MTRFIPLALASLLLAPSAFACGMYIPDDVMLVDALEEIDAVEAVPEVEVARAEDAVIAEAQAEAQAEAEIAVAEVDVDEVLEMKTRPMAKRMKRRARAE